MHYSNITILLASTKEKNLLSASERFQFGKYIRIINEKLYQVLELMTDLPMQDSKSTSKQFFIFFGFNIVYQLLARHLSKEIETMKKFSDRLKLFFAQIRPSFTCTYLALVFSVNKRKSILVKKLAASKKRMVDIGYIPCITQI